MRESDQIERDLDAHFELFSGSGFEPELSRLAPYSIQSTWT